MKRVLIAADDVHTRAWARSALAPLDVAVTECASGELVDAIGARGPDLAVIDGGRDPEPLLRACERATPSERETRLLVIVEPSALAALRMPSRTRADFLVRGGSSDEFGARVRTLLWSGEEVRSEELLRFDQLTVNLATYQAYLDGSPLDFTYLEYALLAFLITHPNRAYSRDMLLQRVWSSEYYGGVRTVDVHVRRVRAKLGPDVGKRLETVRNVGYLWSGAESTHE